MLPDLEQLKKAMIISISDFGEMVEQLVASIQNALHGQFESWKDALELITMQLRQPITNKPISYKLYKIRSSQNYMKRISAIARSNC